MPIPVTPNEVSTLLSPRLGLLFLSYTHIDQEILRLLSTYSPGAQTLTDLREAINRTLLLSIHKATKGRFQLRMDDQSLCPVNSQLLDDVTDELMGLVFGRLKISSDNFLKINDYSLRFQSLNAMKTLCLRFSSFYTKEEYAFLLRMIRSLYPPESYQSWLPDSEP